MTHDMAPFSPLQLWCPASTDSLLFLFMPHGMPLPKVFTWLVSTLSLWSVVIFIEVCLNSQMKLNASYLGSHNTLQILLAQYLPLFFNWLQTTLLSDDGILMPWVPKGESQRLRGSSGWAHGQSFRTSIKRSFSLPFLCHTGVLFSFFFWLWADPS